MLLSRVMARFAGLLALAVCLGACIPDDRHVDEQKDPHFQRGLKLVNSQDYKGAVEEFEKALETDPHSASAHFELGCLYDKLEDSAAAIYHYERHLKLLPNSDQAQLVNERIRGCKQELADKEFSPPITQNLQREVDRLTAENLALRQQLAAWQRAAAAPAQRPAPQPGAEPIRLAAVSPPAAGPTAPSHPRLHVVKQRETISSIAVQYGLKASAVLAVNPRVDPRRLRVGQSVALP
jgi:tetratricopeptide (TPR) repeat protein